MKETIKIIDLLNKIANGEEVPKLIKYSKVYTCILVYNEYRKDYSVNGEYYMFLDRFRSREENYEDVIYQDFLNDEVEIIEEQKILEKLRKTNMTKNQKKIVNKINEIIDYLKEDSYVR